MSSSAKTPDHHIEAAIGYAEPTCLLLSGWVFDGEQRIASIVAQLATEDVAIDRELHWYRRPDVNEHFGALGARDMVGFWAVFPVTAQDLADNVQLRFVMKDGSRRLGEASPITAYDPSRHGVLKGLLARHSPGAFRDLKELSPQPVELLRLLAADLPVHGSGVDVQLERAVWLSDGRMFLSGCVEAPDGVDRFMLIDEETGRSWDLTGLAAWFERDTDSPSQAPGATSTADHRFVALIESPVERSERARPELYLRTGGARLFRTEVHPTQCDGDAAQLLTTFLGALPDRLLGQARLMDRHLGPALTHALSRTPKLGTAPSRDVVFGPPPHNPRVTVAILTGDEPVSLRYQLATLCDDADLHAADIMVLSGNARAAEGALDVARFCYDHFGLPLRVVDGIRSPDEAAIINAAARTARGEFMLILDCDVLATSAGWLGHLVDVMARLPAAGAVGPQLLSEDGTVHHGPSYLVPLPGREWWHVDECATRGFPPSLSDMGREPILVDALSIDCMLVRLDHFLAVGGLSEDYVEGRFADLDLCARLTAAGHELYHVPTASLDVPGRRHLHRLRYGDSLALRADLYNCWLFNQRHQARRAELSK